MLLAAHDHLAVGADRALRVALLQRVQRARDAPRGPQRTGQMAGLGRRLRIADADALVVRQMPQFLPILAALLDAQRAGVDVQRLGQRIPAATVARGAVGVAHPVRDARADVGQAHGVESDQPGHEHAVEGAGHLDADLAVGVEARHLADDAVGDRVTEFVGVTGQHPLGDSRINSGAWAADVAHVVRRTHRSLPPIVSGPKAGCASRAKRALRRNARRSRRAAPRAPPGARRAVDAAAPQ